MNERGAVSEADSVSVDADCGEISVGEGDIGAEGSFVGVEEEGGGEQAEEASDADNMGGGDGTSSSVGSFGVEAVLEASEPVPGLSNDFSSRVSSPTGLNSDGSPSRSAAPSGAEDVSC